MMKRLSIALALLLSVSSAQAIVMGGLIFKPQTTATLSMSNLFNQPKLVVTPPPLPTPAPPVVQAPVPKSATPVPQQFFVFLTDESKTYLDETVNCVDVPKSEGGSNVSAVPVPAALPLMATALGIFGITRRRKTFK